MKKHVIIVNYYRKLVVISNIIDISNFLDKCTARKYYRADIWSFLGSSQSAIVYKDEENYIVKLIQFIVLSGESFHRFFTKNWINAHVGLVMHNNFQLKALCPFGDTKNKQLLFRSRSSPSSGEPVVNNGRTVYDGIVFGQQFEIFFWFFSFLARINFISIVSITSWHWRWICLRQSDRLWWGWERVISNWASEICLLWIPFRCEWTLCKFGFLPRISRLVTLKVTILHNL